MMVTSELNNKIESNKRLPIIALLSDSPGGKKVAIVLFRIHDGVLYH